MKIEGQHMKTDYWHHKWEINDIGFDQQQYNVLLQRYFTSLNLKKGSRIFVPLCGKSIDMLWLVQQGYEVIGVELSEKACEAFFKDNHLSVNTTQIDSFVVFQSNKITLFCGDFFELNKELLGTIDAVYDRAALIALPSDLRSQYVNHLINLIEKGSSLFLITTAYNQNSMQGPPFSVDEPEVRALFEAQFSIHQYYNQAIKAIPTHLYEKGLTHGNEQAYGMVFKGHLK